MIIIKKICGGGKLRGSFYEISLLLSEKEANALPCLNK